MNWRKFALAVVLAPVAGFAVLVVAQPYAPLTRAELWARVAALYRYGAIDVPHVLAPADDPARPLMGKVAAGQPLTADESARYRRAMQHVLADHQTLFRVLDNNLIVDLHAELSRVFHREVSHL